MESSLELTHIHGFLPTVELCIKITKLHRIDKLYLHGASLGIEPGQPVHGGERGVEGVLLLLLVILGQ